jgi:Icc protein
MALSRRDFLKSTFGSVVLISFGNSLQAFAPGDFRLPASKSLRLRFAIASDGHYGEPKTNFIADHENMANWLNKEAQGRGLDFVVINGDVFHNDPTHLPAVKAAWDKLKPPYYVSHGNHDMTEESHWQSIWGIPFYHAFEKEDTGFIILDTADIKGNYTGPDLARTKALLDQYKSKKQVYIFMHITPVKWTKHGIDRPDVIELFNSQANLKAIFHGHDHQEDNVREKGGKYYFWDSHIAGSWGTEYKGYRIVEVLKDGSVLTYQTNPTLNKPVNNNKIG